MNTSTRERWEGCYSSLYEYPNSKPNSQYLIDTNLFWSSKSDWNLELFIWLGPTMGSKTP